MKFYVLASSSSGNSAYIETSNRKILIDAGISYTRIKEGLKKIDVHIKDITDIFITHEHKDHINGLKILLKYTNPTVYMSNGTYDGIKEDFEYAQIKAYESVFLDELTVLPLPLSHDAREPLGFHFKNKTKSITYITDTGYIYKDVLKHIKDSTLYFIESNHDPHLLINSARPYYLINRILNEKGHLSNYDSAYYISQIYGDNTTHVVFAHISQECNTTKHIKETFLDVIDSTGKQTDHIKFVQANAAEPTPVIKL